MTLSQRKIPILTGVNDVPSSTGQANHPNASLLCKNYNDLIDNELTAINNVLSSIPSSNKPDATNYDIYLDTTATTNGTGTQANPFKTVSVLLSELNSKIYNDNITVIIVGNANLGDLTLSVTTVEESESDSRIRLGIYGELGTENIAIGSINTNILIEFDDMVLTTDTISIMGDVQFYVPISGTSITVNNGSITSLTNITIPTIYLNYSHLSCKNSILTGVVINANHSDVFLADVTGSVNLTLENSDLIMNQCNINNTSGNVTLMDILNSNVKIANLTYLPSNPEEVPIINVQQASTLIAKTINFTQSKINGTGVLTIVNNSII
jgi:hypothetical protein